MVRLSAAKAYQCIAKNMAGVALFLLGNILCLPIKVLFWFMLVLSRPLLAFALFWVLPVWVDERLSAAKVLQCIAKTFQCIAWALRCTAKYQPGSALFFVFTDCCLPTKLFVSFLRDWERLSAAKAVQCIAKNFAGFVLFYEARPVAAETTPSAPAASSAAGALRNMTLRLRLSFP